MYSKFLNRDIPQLQMTDILPLDTWMAFLYMNKNMRIRKWDGIIEERSHLLTQYVFLCEVSTLSCEQKLEDRLEKIWNIVNDMTWVLLINELNYFDNDMVARQNEFFDVQSVENAVKTMHHMSSIPVRSRLNRFIKKLNFKIVRKIFMYLRES